MTISKLIKDQKKTFGPKIYKEGSTTFRIIAKVRYDDQCGNGYNSFAITGSIDKQGKYGEWIDDISGCIHDEITKHFPELQPYIKWHLCGSNSPMHYVANTVYHAKNGNLDYARSTAIWPEASLDELQSEVILKMRLPDLMKEFQQAMESLGFTY